MKEEEKVEKHLNSEENQLLVSFLPVCTVLMLWTRARVCVRAEHKQTHTRIAAAEHGAEVR